MFVFRLQSIHELFQREHDAIYIRYHCTGNYSPTMLFNINVALRGGIWSWDRRRCREII